MPSVQVPLAAARPGCFASPHPRARFPTQPVSLTHSQHGGEISTMGLHLKLAALNTSAGRRKVATGFWKRSRALALSRSPTPTPPASSFPLGKGFVRRHCPGSRGFAGVGGGGDLISVKNPTPPRSGEGEGYCRPTDGLHPGIAEAVTERLPSRPRSPTTALPSPLLGCIGRTLPVARVGSLSRRWAPSPTEHDKMLSVLPDIL